MIVNNEVARTQPFAQRGTLYQIRIWYISPKHLWLALSLYSEQVGRPPHAPPPTDRPAASRGRVMPGQRSIQASARSHDGRPQSDKLTVRFRSDQYGLRNKLIPQATI